MVSSSTFSFSSSASLLTSTPSTEHIMMVYDSDDERNIAAVNYINSGLKSGYQCIYASIDAYDSTSSFNISNLSYKINNYKENYDCGELKIVNFKPFYESALQGDLSPFKKLKVELEETLINRKYEGKNDAILVFADAACFLSHNKHFHECENLEKWWDETTIEWIQNNLSITVVCPHPKQVLNNPLFSDTKVHLISMHTRTVDCTTQPTREQKQNRRIKLLIVEPDPDIQYLYLVYSRYYGFPISDVKVVQTGSKCLEYLFSNQEEKNDNGVDDDYDIIIIDTHLPDISGFEVAREINNKLPNKKRIVLTTTYSLSDISQIIDSIGLKSDDVILKPFKFSHLFSILKESRMSYN